MKDVEVAQKMVKFMELNTIGVSKDSQLRAAKILKAVCDGYELSPAKEANRLFHFAQRKMAERWSKLRATVAASAGMFSLPNGLSGYCTFAKEIVTANPRKHHTSNIVIEHIFASYFCLYSNDFLTACFFSSSICMAPLSQGWCRRLGGFSP